MLPTEEAGRARLPVERKVRFSLGTDDGEKIAFSEGGGLHSVESFSAGGGGQRKMEPR